MIISNNRHPYLHDFENLVANATMYLNNAALQNTEYFLKRNAQLLEQDVFFALNESAKNTMFQDTITVVSGQKFPDIVAAGYFGVEVKSSKDEHWITLGGSVNESTRVDGIERIFLTFGKLTSPIEFRSRPYEDCLSEVVVTHYPRYKINMNLSTGETIFDKMSTTYDELRSADNPVRQIVNYYKTQLRDGESLWWIDSGGNIENLEYSATPSMTVRLWSSLEREEKNRFTTQLFALFPDILSSSSTKYNRAVLWLASHHGIVDPSFRDKFTAGGRVTINTRQGNFTNLPKIFEHIQMLSHDIQLLINNTPFNILCETWGISKVDNDRILQWISLIAAKHHASDYSCIEVLKAIFCI